MSESIFLTVKINDKCQPIDRGEMYSDPVDDALSEKGFGEVVGEGSQLDDDFKVAYCELEVELKTSLETGAKLIIETLEKAEIPKGSQIIIDGNCYKEFGATEVLAVSLDCLTLPDEVYEKNDINDSIASIEELLGEHGEMSSHKMTNEDLIIYYKGLSFSKMKDLMGEYMNTHPLFVNSKVFQEA